MSITGLLSQQMLTFFETLWLPSVLFVLGLIILYYGAEGLIRGATSTALRYGIRPLVVGLTVVALGTSMPEFVVNFLAAFQQAEALALGNIIGSNIANIGLILGTAILLAPFEVDATTLRKEYPMMMTAMIAFYLLSLDGAITRVDGLLLVAGLVVVIIFLIRDAQKNPYKTNLEDIPELRKEDMQAPWWKRAGLIVGGIVALSIGARLMVESAVTIAETFGVSQIIIGLSIVAVGTSLPELATSVVGAIRGEGDLSLGNVLGSNLFNILFVVGLVSLIRPLPVDQESLYFHFPVMLGFGIILFPLAEIGKRLTRFGGFILLSAYISYLGYLVHLATSN